ncbi:MAG TPA: hypothetical protein VN025_18590 [Candidatus Dormibacteraeota bacterium]|jgi:hypothetical protein|nr:hypothetical protein [Candidatus Dormibacteraeota bacterium]
MKTPTLVRTLWLGSVVAISAAGVLSSAVCAQSQDNASQSVAEAARKAKEQKKSAPKENRVITDDTINLRPASADSSGAPPAGTVIVSSPAANSTGTAAPPADSSTTQPVKIANVAPAVNNPSQTPSDPKAKEAQSAEVAKAKELLAQVQAELDVLKRELALDSDSFFSNPDYSHDADGKAKLDELQKMIGDKQISVEDLKKQLAELMKQAGISPDADKAPAPPKN